MINSQGLDDTFALLKEHYPSLTVHEYPSGTHAEDWEVPLAWRCNRGVMQGRDGEIIASFEENPLFVAPYSEPVNGWFSKTEIATHLRTRKDMPDAFALEHRNAYNYQLKDWGITLPYNRWTDLPEEKYHIEIDVDFYENSMKVGEWIVPGEHDSIICLNAHIDELCNDDLSGCIVGLEAMRVLEKQGTKKYSYQLLLSPELIGTIFFVHNNPDTLKRTAGLLNLEALGAGKTLALKHALTGEGYLEAALAAALSDLEISYTDLSFFEGYGNDERVYEWPTIGIPGIALQRFPFSQYHTSEDTPDNIDYSLMESAVQSVLHFVEVLENDAIPSWRNTLPPWLTKRGLYFDCTHDPEKFQKLNNTVLFNVNGSNSILDLARMASIGFHEVKEFLDKFAEQGCLVYTEYHPPRLNRQRGSAG